VDAPPRCAFEAEHDEVRFAGSAPQLALQ
jgi:hypothetical protein